MTPLLLQRHRKCNCPQWGDNKRRMAYLKNRWIFKPFQVKLQQHLTLISRARLSQNAKSRGLQRKRKNPSPFRHLESLRGRQITDCSWLRPKCFSCLWASMNPCCRWLNGLLYQCFNRINRGTETRCRWLLKSFRWWQMWGTSRLCRTRSSSHNFNKLKKARTPCRLSVTLTTPRTNSLSTGPL